MKLYEIVDEFEQLADNMDSELGEGSTEQYEEKLNALSLSFENKANNVAAYVKNLESDETAIADEIKRLQARAKSIASRTEWLKKYLKVCMERLGIDKLNAPLFKIAIQKNPPSVVIADESKIPTKYWIEIPARREIDKKSILSDWKNGIGVSGADVIDTNTRLVIK